MIDCDETDKKTEKIYIVAKARVTEGFYTVKKGAALPYDLLDEFKGAGLEGKAYQPLFDYFVEQVCQTPQRRRRMN